MKCVPDCLDITDRKNYGDVFLMIKIKNLFSTLKGHMRLCSLIIAIFAVLLLSMSSAALAEVSNYSISPANPSPGDTVTVKGYASPREEVSASVSFENELAVSDGIYEYYLQQVTIPEGSDSFSVQARGVDELGIEVKLPVIGFTSVPQDFIQMSGDVATFGTSKINSGTYDIVLSGVSSADKVTLSFNAKASINADDEGYFEYSYTTDNMPEGNFNVNIGGVPSQLSLGNTGDKSDDDQGDDTGTKDDNIPVSASSSSKKSSSSHTGTDLRIVPADTPEDSGDTEEDNEENTGSDTSKPEEGPEPLESTPENIENDYVEGYELEDESSGIRGKITEPGSIAFVLGIICLGAIIIGYRKNRYK